MKIKFWQVLCFVMIVVGMTIAVFPGRKDLVALYLKSNMLVEARETVDGFLQDSPDDPELLALSSTVTYLFTSRDANHYLGENRPLKAYPYFRDLAVHSGGNKRDVMKMLTVAGHTGEQEIALKAADLAGKLLPTDEQCLKKRAELYLAAQDLDKAYRAFRALTRLTETDEDEVLKLLEVAGFTSDKLVIAEAVAQALDLFPDNVAVLAAASTMCLWIDRPLQALRLATKAAVGSKGEVQKVRHMIDVAGQVGHPRHKEEVLLLAHELSPSDNIVKQEIRNFYTNNFNFINLQKGHRILTGLLNEDPDNVNLMLLNSKMHYLAGDSTEAARALSVLISKGPENDRLMIILAKLLEWDRKPGKALEVWERIIDLNPGDSYFSARLPDLYGVNWSVTDIPENRADLYKHLISYYQYYGDIDKEGAAIVQVMRLEKRSSPALVRGDAFARLLRKELYYHVQGYREGKDNLYLNALICGLYAVRSQYLENLAEAEKGRHPDTDTDLSAKRCLEYLVNYDQGDRSLLFAARLDRLQQSGFKNRLELVKIMRWSGLEHEAMRVFLKIADLNQFTEEKAKEVKGNTLLEFARVAEALGFISQAYRFYSLLYQSHPDDPFVQEKLLQVSGWTGHSDRAATILAAISEKDPQNYNKALAAGEAFIAANNLGKGIGYLERALRLEPGQRGLRKKLATYYGWAGQSKKRVRALKKLEALGLLEEGGRLSLARAYLDSGDGVKAVKLLNSWEKKERLPQDPGIMLALAYELAGQAAAALQVYLRLSSEYSEDPKLLSRIGSRAFSLNQPGLALRFFEMALKKDSKNLAALKGSAQVFAWNSDTEQAIKRFELYNRLNPNDYEATYQLGELYFADNRIGEANKQYDRTRKLIKKIKAVQKGKDASR